MHALECTPHEQDDGRESDTLLIHTLFLCLFSFLKEDMRTRFQHHCSFFHKYTVGHFPISKAFSQ